MFHPERIGIRKPNPDVFMHLAPELHLRKLLKGNVTRLEAIINIMVVVGNLIGKIDELRLDDRNYTGKEAVDLASGGVIGGRVL
jgi:hypothetical protein